jgi:hypothetical protein
LIAIGSYIHRVSLLAEPLFDEASDFAIVFDDEDFHGRATYWDGGELTVNGP